MHRRDEFPELAKGLSDNANLEPDNNSQYKNPIFYGTIKLGITLDVPDPYKLDGFSKVVG
jgi:hypothetical protein